MSHYYDAKQEGVKSNPKRIAYTFNTIDFSFMTDHGTFSKDHIDSATELLLKNVTVPPGSTILDLGCGYGVIGIILSKLYEGQTTMVDVNERAIALARENISRNNVDADCILSDGFSALNAAQFDFIISNPPIRIGKEKLYQLLDEAYNHLTTKGALFIVMHKKHGALSAMKHLNKRYTVSLVKRNKGFHVIKCKKR